MKYTVQDILKQGKNRVNSNQEIRQAEIIDLVSDSDQDQDKHTKQERKTYLIVEDPEKFSSHRGMVKLIESSSHKEMSKDEECKNQKKLKNGKELVTKVGK